MIGIAIAVVLVLALATIPPRLFGAFAGWLVSRLVKHRKPPW